MIRKCLTKVNQSRQTGHAAFDIAVINHDIAKDFRGIETFVPTKASVILVRGKAAILILIRQEHVTGVKQAFLVNGQQTAVLEALLNRLGLQEAEYTLETFSGTIRNGPSVGTRRKGPTSFGYVTIKFLPITIKLLNAFSV